MNNTHHANGGDPQQTSASGPVFNILRVYLKDLSLEQPDSPWATNSQGAPNIEVRIDVGHQVLEPGVFEVFVLGSVHATFPEKTKERSKTKDSSPAQGQEKTLFLVEAKQAGIFQIQNIPERDLELLLEINAPHIVYPYLRATLADIIVRAGFPPVHLAEVNFQALFEQRKQELQHPALRGLSVPGSTTLQ